MKLDLSKEEKLYVEGYLEGLQDGKEQRKDTIEALKKLIKELEETECG